MSKQKLAVFDIDGTIFRSSLLIELTEEMIARGVFPPGARRQYLREKDDWQNRVGEYEEYIMSVVRAFGKNIKGVKWGEFKKASEAVLCSNKNKVYKYTRDLVRDLKKKNYYLLAISHSPKYIVHDFAMALGFNKVYGRILELDKNKRFTGRVMHEELIMDKAKIMDRAIERESLTLRGSVGVGDTESDVAFLKMVERPICFNPNSLLYRVARKNNWLVVVERKDVIYKI